MSLMRTVTKMAIGFAVAKGVSSMTKGGGLGKIMEGLSPGAGQTASRQGTGMEGLSDIMGKLGGGDSQQAGSTGGISDLLGQLTGGGQAAPSGGLGGLGALLGGLAGARGGTSGTGLEALLNQDNPADEPDEDEIAKLMLRAMTQVARADGDIDANEKKNLVEMLKSGDPGDAQVLKDIMSQPVDAKALAADTPRGLETQVYTISVNSITPDNQAEAQYLHALAEGLNITPEQSNAIHDSLGAPRLYR